MRHPLSSSGTRLILTVFFVGLALAAGLFGAGESKRGWAAPEQNPNLQTIPTRFPEETTEPPQAPSPVPKLPTRQQADNNDNEDDDKPTATATPSVEQNSPEANASPTDLPKSTAKNQTSQPAAGGANLEQGNIHATQEPVKEDEAQISSPPTVISTPPPVAVHAGRGQFATSVIPGSEGEEAPDSHGYLLWLYALAVGLILIVSGIVLVRRA